MQVKCPHLARSVVVVEAGQQMPLTPEQSAMPLSALLKQMTQPQHDEAEHHPLHAVLFGSAGVEAAREAYVRLLGQHLVIQEAFEPLVRQEAGRSGAIGAVVREHHHHLAALRDDVRELGIGRELMAPVAATERMCSFIQMCAQHGAALLGVMYVFEGSTNGGTIIAKRMRELLGFAGDHGTRFINPHGQMVRARWMEWKQALDGLTFDATQRHGIIGAAQETFRLSGAVLSDVHGAMSVRL